jgi:hypothetical protein
MEKWCLGARCLGTRPIADSELVVLQKEAKRIRRTFWLLWAGLFVCIPYVVLSVIGTILGVAFLVQGGFLVGMVLLYPIVISALTYRNYRDAYRDIAGDLDSKLVEIYEADPAHFFRTPRAGLLLSEGMGARVQYAAATSVEGTKVANGFPQRVPIGAMERNEATQRTLLDSEAKEIQIQRRLLKRAWIAPTIVLSAFFGAMIAAVATEGNALESLGSLIFLAVPGYCAYRWMVAAKMARLLTKDLQSEVILQGVQEFNGESRPIEYLPHSRLIWTVDGAPSSHRSN